MNVAMLTREFPPEVYGGAGVHVEHLSAELDRRADVDVRVHCFGGPRSSPLVAANYQPWTAVPTGPSVGSALATMSVDLLMAAAVEGCDLVHSHTWYANLGGHLAKLLHGVPHVMTSHSLEPLRPWKADQLGGGYQLSKFCERTGLASADAVIAVSGAMRDDVLRAYPGAVDPDRVEVIHNGVDPQVYSPDPGTAVLERLGVDPNRPIVVFVGRIVAQKGIDHLLDAAPLLDGAAQLILCAAAPDTAALQVRMEERVRALQAVREGVVWVQEALPRADVVQLLSHGIFVCPSIYEPFGLVNVEAMACGAPVVASRVGGIGEIVVDGETGWLVAFEVEPDNPMGAPSEPDRFARDLAERVNDLVADPEKARRFGQAGRARVLEHFSWTAIADQTAELYCRLTSDAGRR